MADFTGSYHQHFRVIRADRPELLDHAYRLRYQVYCVENPFEDPTRCLDRREIDGEDDRAVHTLLVHRRSAAAIGTARLILPQPDRGRPLPMERLLRPGERAALSRLPLHQTAEVSRFAVSKEFRRRCGEERYADAGFPAGGAAGEAAERRLLPHITFGLVRGILGLALEYGITILVAVMEPALLRILARMGLHFTPLGPLVEHHGLRQPAVARIAELIRHSREQAGLLWRYVEADIASIGDAGGVAAIGPTTRAGGGLAALSSAPGFL